MYICIYLNIHIYIIGVPQKGNSLLAGDIHHGNPRGEQRSKAQDGHGVQNVGRRLQFKRWACLAILYDVWVKG